MYVCMGEQNEFMYAYMYAVPSGQHLQCVCMSICMYINICVCICMYINMCVSMYVCVCMYVCMGEQNEIHT